MKRICLCMLLCCSLFIVNAQQSTLKPVTVGEYCPDLPIKNIINYKTSTARISDYKGKLLILDFWATWCAPCLSMMPVADKLQHQFNNDLQIMPVTAQSKSEVQNFLQQRAKSTGITPPTATADALLSAVFPHEVIPHYVWIGKDGRVIGITGYGALNEQNIQTAIATNSIDVELKDDRYKKINEANPMFYVANVLQQEESGVVDTIQQSDLLYHSVLTGFIPGFFCEAGSDSLRITVKNESIGDLYRIAASKYDLLKLNANSTVWEVKNKTALPYTDSAGSKHQQPDQIMPWLKAYTFCYELKTPPSLQQKQFDIMLADLNNYFGVMLGIQGSLERRKTKCLVLKQTGNTEKLISQGGPQALRYDATTIKLQNQKVSTLINILSFNLDRLPPIVNQSGIQKSLDIDLNADMSNLQSVNNALKEFGLTLQEQEAEIDMIVIRDKE